MTQANIRRIEKLVASLQKLVKERTNAEAAMYVLLDAQASIGVIQMDLHFRPEVNS